MAGHGSSAILKDVVAYVDVWSSDKTDNYSKPFVKQLQELGAEVSKTFNKQVTHVVFKNGHQATWVLAKKRGSKLVSVLWVARCKEDGEHVDEELFPALNDELNSVFKKRTHRCMQPRHSPDRTPTSDRRMRKKLDKMMKDLAAKTTPVKDLTTYVIDEETGIVYSPSLKRSDSMAKRLKEMREKREALSPTASQMPGSSLSPELKPSCESTPTVLKFSSDEQRDDESTASFAAQLDELYDQKKESKNDDINHAHSEPQEKGVEEPWLSPCRDVPIPKLFFPSKFPDLEDEEKGTKQNRKSKRRSVRRESAKKPNTLSSLEIPCQDIGSEDRRISHKEKAQLAFGSLSHFFVKGKQSKKGKENRGTVQFPAVVETVTEPRVSNSSGSLSTTNTCGSVINQEPPSEITSPLHPQTSKQTRPPLSSLAQAFTFSASAAMSAAGDDDDGVFEDFFSPANHQQTQQRLLLPSLCFGSGVQIPFELEPVTKKRKQSSSRATGSESDQSKRKKWKETQGAKNSPWLSNCARSKPEILETRPHELVRETPSPMDSYCISAAPLTKISRLSTSLMGIGEITNRLVKQRTSATEGQTPKLSLRGSNSVSDQPRNSDDNVFFKSVGSRGSKHTAAAGVTEASTADVQCHNQQLAVTVKKMGKETKTVRTLVMTSMPTEKQGIVIQVVRALGGFSIIDQVRESTTHVVSGGHQRTVNVLLGIARGCWILSFEWILSSLEQRRWIPEEPYELSDYFPAATICRLQKHLSAGEHQQDLFQDQPAMFVSQYSQPPTHILVELIQLFGGTVCRTIRQAGICIGKYNGRRPEGTRILSEQWVLDCITHLKQLSSENYNLE